ncbi:TerD domain-containing protein [Paenibacillus sp. yr247]|uniref:TerD family protein n=1 Tax=Paenibacillus sp. yr247 TaxID=1761880 RepID=UPI0008866875|nr:TerD family protein [Paenibacillus sp. yr247]SDO81197.1 TerD domain-containing protein [Paenibacillus sp. yr247]
MLRYELGNQFSVETAIFIGELYRYGAEWKFSAVGSGFSGGLKATPTIKPPLIPPAPIN